MRTNQLVGLLSLSIPVLSKHNEYCKPTPGSAHWPSIEQWNALNESVSGRLSNVVPPGAVCHPHRPEYNHTACDIVSTQWKNTSFTSRQPVSVDYNDETCLPNADAPCSNVGYPEYVIIARSADDVMHGVAFARQTGVRLVIKGTGHDYPGRSSGGESLAIYTHNIRGLSINRNDSEAQALGAVGSVRIYAGEQMRDVYKFGSKNKVTLMGGADLDVGAGGWVSGGGHGPLTAHYGMGADQVVRMQVVTADGCLKMIDATHDADLFWALRGGGAGTFAVLIYMDVKAYPAVGVSSSVFSYNTTADSEAFWDMVTYFHTQLPHLSESGLSGYYFVSPGSGTLYGLWLGANLSVNQTNAILSPVEAYMKNASWPDKVNTGSVTTAKDDFMTYWLSSNPPQGAGFSGRLGSRLLSNHSLLGDPDKLKSALRKSSPAPNTLLGHLVAPAPNTLHPKGLIAGNTSALLPAWRTAYTHIVLPRLWPAHNATAKKATTTDLREIRVQALRDLEPGSGAYMSESDPTEPSWQRTKFGDEHYPRLLAIKKKWDPGGVFWCKQCVGSELWEARGVFGIENGVGQNQVRLCRPGRA